MSVSENTVDFAANTTTNGWANTSGLVYGSISPSSDSDWFRTYLVAGVNYQIQMYGQNLDSYLVLRNSFGTQIDFADRGGLASIETINFTPSFSGYYFVDAQSYRISPYNTGFYLVSLDASGLDDFLATTGTTSQLLMGQTKTGSIERPADADWHQINLFAGQTYQIALSGALAGGYLKIFDSNGFETGVADASRLTFSPTNSGIYYVEVSGQNLTESGSYGVTASVLPTISISNGYLKEGDSGTTAMRFIASLSATSNLPITFQLSTQDDTAVAGSDYVTLNRSITIPAGSLSTTVDVEVIGNNYFEPNRVFSLTAGAAMNAGGNYTAYGYIYDDDKPSNVDLPTDVLFGFQWYLYTTRAYLVWEKATGKGIKVGVFDQGIDNTNPDLKFNTSAELGRNALTLSTGGSPLAGGDNHGTWVAGVIAASRDGVGTVGIAYDATLVSIYTSSSLTSQYVTEIVNAFKYAKSLDVLNNSWGFGNLLFSGTNWAFLDNARDPLFAPAFVALRDLAASGRSGLGTVVVQSAGNSYSVGDDTNLHNFQNSRYIITVGATDYFGKISPFSTTGASVLVSAPGGGGGTNANSILTTDRSGVAGGHPGDYKYVDGTSFSSPVVSGIVALMLQTNPKLGYRDVQEILAYTAQRIDTGVGRWEINSAKDWNGGGMHYNALDHATGFGQVDALAAVRLAAGWDTTPKTVSNTKELVSTKTVAQAIPDNNRSGVFSQMAISESMRVERVDVTISITHPYIGDLSILLTSPNGATSFLMYRPAKGGLSAYGSSQENVNFTFNTVLNWGEDARGTWLISVYDNDAGFVGTFNSWTLNLIGSPDSKDKTYIYTKEFGDYVALDATRAVLDNPNGGNHTINAAALGLDNRIDLSSVTPSVLNGTNLTIAKGTLVTKGVGGDGNDIIIANDLGNFLKGMGGADLLKGGANNDQLDGGLGVDTALYTPVVSNYTVTKTTVSGTTTYTVKDKTGADGTDTLTNVEALKFFDKSINLTIQAQAKAAPAADVTRLSELYVAFFNRIPDADGLSYWIGQKVAGQSISQIADTFYNAGVQFSSLTGFTATMSNADFVNVVYKNVLGRKDGADAGGLAYWTGKLADGSATRGDLVSTILDSAHTFKGDATYGYVADLLDNKIAVAKTFAIDLGLNYNTSNDSITNGMAIAAAVTPTSTAAAISLIGVNIADVQLS